MTETFIYGYPNQVHDLAEKYVARDIISNQTMLVNEVLSNHHIGIVGINYENISNLYNPNNEEEIQEIYEWWLVSEWLAKELEKLGQPVLFADYDFYWGRTCTGQSIILDGTIQEIAKKYAVESPVTAESPTIIISGDELGYHERRAIEYMLMAWNDNNLPENFTREGIKIVNQNGSVFLINSENQVTSLDGYDVILDE